MLGNFPYWFQYCPYCLWWLHNKVESIQRICFLLSKHGIRSFSRSCGRCQICISYGHSVSSGPELRMYEYTIWQLSLLSPVVFLPAQKLINRDEGLFWSIQLLSAYPSWRIYRLQEITNPKYKVWPSANVPITWLLTCTCTELLGCASSVPLAALCLSSWTASRFIPHARHFWYLQYWHLFLCRLSMIQLRSSRHAYVRSFLTVRLKKPLQPSQLEQEG